MDFKLEICFHIKNAIDFEPSAKNKMAAIIVFKCML